MARTVLPSTSLGAGLLLGALGLGLLSLGCSTEPAQALSPSHVEALATRLASCKLVELATALAMDPQVGAVWKAFPDAADYATLIEDPQRPAPVRFAAALMLRSASVVELKKVSPRAVAEVLATALEDDLAGYAFPWGALWAPGDGVGRLGELVIDLGPPAEQAFGALLDDATTRDSYLGRDESAVMAKRQYRVKDFAAFYLAKIANLPLAWEPDLTRRDAAIEALRRQLPELPPAVARPERPGLTSNSQPARGWLQTRPGTPSARTAQCPGPRSPSLLDHDVSVCRR